MACCAESEDGIHWSRPEPGIVEFDGNKRNNMLLMTCPFTPFKDPNPSAPENQRYKAIVGGMNAYASADGIRWESVFPSNATRGRMKTGYKSFPKDVHYSSCM